MTSSTERYALTKLDPGESVHAGDGRFPSSDRDTIDAALWAGVQHKHTGATIATGAPTIAPTLTLGTGGTIPAGTTVRYKYTIVDSSTGETIPAPEAYVTTPDALVEPVAPTSSLQSIGGTLEPGGYYYVLTHYETSSTVETKATNALYVSIPAGTSTNEVTLTLPTAVAGATGFNIYRRAPGETRYYFLASVVAATAQYVDGGTAADGNRSLPIANTTGANNKVTVSVPSLVGNKQWRIYRSYTTNYSNSLLVQKSSNVTTHEDTGAGTTIGAPPTSGAVSAPSQIDLASEVQGVLPITSGGTGAITHAAARSALQLEVGVDVQAFSSVLQATTASFLTADRTKLDDAPTVLRAVKVADETRTNSINSLSDAALFFTTATNSTYIIDGFLIYSSDAAADITFAWTVPAGATIEWWIVDQPDASTLGVLDGAGVGVKRYRALKGTLTTAGTGGTATIRWGQTTAHASNTTVHARSHLLATRV